MTRIALAALALGLLAATPAFAGNRADDGGGYGGGYGGQSEGHEADTAGQFMNSLFGDDHPSGRGLGGTASGSRGTARNGGAVGGTSGGIGIGGTH